MPINSSNYSTLRQVWTNPGERENFYVSYAVRGPTVLAQYLSEPKNDTIETFENVNNRTCGSCQGINGMTFPDRSLVRKLYDEGKLTEYTYLPKSTQWTKNSWDC